MKKLLVFSILAFVLLSCHKVFAAGPVLALEEEELDNYLKKKPVVMLDVYTPTCPHCKALAPEFLKAAKQAQASRKAYAFVKIDARDNPGLGSKYQITGFPTLKLFVNGNPIDYEGNRTAEAILAFIDKKTGSQSTFLQSETEFQNVVSAKGSRV